MRLVGRLRKDAIASWEFEEAFWLPFRAYPDWGFFELSVTLGTEVFWGNAPLFVCFWGAPPKLVAAEPARLPPLAVSRREIAALGFPLILRLFFICGHFEKRPGF